MNTAPPLPTDTAAAEALPADAPTTTVGHESPPPARRAVLRTACYSVALACLASVLMFWELGEDAFTGDEAQYALVVQNIRRSGDWLNLSPYPPAPYLQKPPLYFWLTAMTYDALGGAELAARAWSAGAGVGAVVLTCVLGAMLFTPEVGGLAGLLLMLNRSFLLVHGARSGTFDALLAFLAAACAVVYWAAARNKWPWTGWAAIGVLGGLASITKPFAGVPIVALLAVHAILAEGRGPLWRRVGGPAVAVILLAAVAAPWFVDQWRQHPHFVDEVFRRNLVERVTQGLQDTNVKRWTFYPQEISKSSPPFLFLLPATAYALWACAKGPRRSAHALVALMGVGWVALFSLSAGKTIHYAYPALPALAIVLADAAVRLTGAAGRRLRPAARQRAAYATAAAVLAFAAFAYARTLYHAVPADRSPYVPWELHEVLAPAIRAGDARVVFAGFPEHQVDWRIRLGLRARDCYYLEQMRPHARWTTSRAELDRLLADHTPTLLVIARTAEAEALFADKGFTPRLDERFVYPHGGYVVAGIDLRPLVQPSLKPGETNRYLRLEGETSPGEFRIAVTPPTRGAARLSVSLRLAEGVADGAVRYAFVLSGPGGNRKRIDDNVVASVNGRVELSAMIEEPLWKGQEPHRVTLTLKPAGPDAAEPVRSAVEGVRLTMLPEIPAERFPRR